MRCCVRRRAPAASPPRRPIWPAFRWGSTTTTMPRLARVTALRNQGKALKEVLAANLTAPYDKTTQGDTQQSKDRFITEVYDEVKDFPPVVDGKRTMPTHP